MTKTSKFYVISCVHHQDESCVLITTAANGCVDGFCGTDGDGWMTWAHGEFDTLEEARSVAESLAALCECTLDDLESFPTFEFDDGAVVVALRPRFQVLSDDESRDFVAGDSLSEVCGNSTDDEIDHLVAAYEEQANGDGYTLDCDAVKASLIVRRDHLCGHTNNSVTN